MADSAPKSDSARQNERLQKLMARAGIGSRRENEGYISAGRVRVNGKVARLGDSADPALDSITFDDAELRLEPLVYVMLNKPKGVLSSTEDELEKGRTTVRDLIPLPGHLYPVGRLDRQSRGLMLLTNDGDLAHKLTHPSYGHEKVYKVVLDGQIGVAALTQWSEGVMLEGKRTLPAQIEILHIEKDRSKVRITLKEGRKRQIRKVAAMLGYPVKQLTRERIGTLRLGDLNVGEWRHLTSKEVRQLKRSVERGKVSRRGSSRKPPAARKPPSRQKPARRQKR